LITRLNFQSARSLQVAQFSVGVNKSSSSAQVRRSETWRRNANRLRETGRPGSFGVRVGTSVRDNHDAATAKSTTAAAAPPPAFAGRRRPEYSSSPAHATTAGATGSLGGCYSDTAAATTPLQRVLAAPLPAWVESGARLHNRSGRQLPSAN
jgi:hypothetical protein